MNSKNLYMTGTFTNNLKNDPNVGKYTNNAAFGHYNWAQWPENITLNGDKCKIQPKNTLKTPDKFKIQPKNTKKTHDWSRQHMTHGQKHIRTHGKLKHTFKYVKNMDGAQQNCRHKSKSAAPKKKHTSAMKLFWNHIWNEGADPGFYPLRSPCLRYTTCGLFLRICWFIFWNLVTGAK